MAVSFWLGYCFIWDISFFDIFRWWLMRTVFKLSLAAICVSNLTACASLELSAVSGIAYLITGKSLSDHALSQVAQKDCALHRFLLSQSICSDKDSNQPLDAQEPDVLLAQTSETPASEAVATPIESELALSGQKAFSVQEALSEQEAFSEQIAQSDISVTFADSLSLPQEASSDAQESSYNNDLVAALNTTLDAINTAEAPQKAQESQGSVDHLPIDSLSPAMANHEQTSLFAVLGSFNTLAYAQTRQHYYRNLDARIIPVNDTPNINYRVIMPIEDKADLQYLEQLVAPENHAAWSIELCGNSFAPPPCGKSDELVAKL